MLIDSKTFQKSALGKSTEKYYLKVLTLIFKYPNKTMLSKVYSSATYGIDAYIIEVETHCEKQIPSFTIVGLPDSAVKESRERVTASNQKQWF